MRVSFLIVHYNQPKLLKECLGSIYKNIDFKDFEIIVVNNSLNCNLKNLEKLFPKTKFIIPQKNLGFGAGNNLAAAHATGDYFFILNPDTKIISFTKNLLEQAFKKPHTGLVAPLLKHSQTSVQDSLRRFPSFFDLVAHRIGKKFFKKRSLKYLLKDKNKTAVQDIPWAVGAAFIISKPVFKKLKGFDEKFFLFFEDTDLCRRVWLNKLKVVFYPQIILFHKEHRLSGGGFCGIFKKTFWIHTFSALKYFWKYKFQKPPKN